jgi:hypothetical protein
MRRNPFRDDYRPVDHGAENRRPWPAWSGWLQPQLASLHAIGGMPESALSRF